MLGLGGFLLLVLLVVWWGLQPIRGTIHFGICKTLAEQHLTYPGTMRVVSYDLLSAYDRAERTMRIYYSYTDAFGESKQDILRCTFEADAQRNMLLTIKSARINRVEIPAEDIARFNATIPAILTYEPDLILLSAGTGVERSENGLKRKNKNGIYPDAGGLSQAFIGRASCRDRTVLRPAGSRAAGRSGLASASQGRRPAANQQTGQGTIDRLARRACGGSH